jgi:ferredoxin
MVAKVNQETCIGCGVCVDHCPEVFELNDDGCAITQVHQVPAELKEKCREASANCPVDSICLED